MILGCGNVAVTQIRIRYLQGMSPENARIYELSNEISWYSQNLMTPCQGIGFGLTVGGVEIIPPLGNAPGIVGTASAYVGVGTLIACD